MDAAEPDNSSSPDPRGSDPDDPQARRDAAYAEYSASISNAWKSAPTRGPSAAPRIERERERVTNE
jgi:hypothetical protein